jgi:hypothetical protein
MSYVLGTSVERKFACAVATLPWIVSFALPTKVTDAAETLLVPAVQRRPSIAARRKGVPSLPRKLQSIAGLVYFMISGG